LERVVSRRECIHHGWATSALVEPLLYAQEIGENTFLATKAILAYNTTKGKSKELKR
jgi:hypothetical protein